MSSLISLVEAMYPRRGEEWVSTHANWPLCLMLRIGMRETEPVVAIENNSADYLQLIVPNLHRRYSGVIATNDISASFLKRNATVIPHGVDTKLYKPPVDRAAAFAEAGLQGRYAIGCFGRVRAQKGSDVFVGAMCRLLPRYPDFTAILVGAITPEHTAFANQLEKRIAAAGLQSRIVITGELSIEEVQRWYQRLTIYAFTSRNEGFGLTLIEAMSAAAAQVASRAGAAELVVEDGVTGMPVPPGPVHRGGKGTKPVLRRPLTSPPHPCHP